MPEVMNRMRPRSHRTSAFDGGRPSPAPPWRRGIPRPRTGRPTPNACGFPRRS